MVREAPGQELVKKSRGNVASERTVPFKHQPPRVIVLVQTFNPLNPQSIGNRRQSNHADALRSSSVCTQGHCQVHSEYWEDGLLPQRECLPPSAGHPCISVYTLADGWIFWYTVTLNSCHSFHLHIWVCFFLSFIYLFILRERERERESPRQAPHCQHGNG